MLDGSEPEVKLCQDCVFCMHERGAWNIHHLALCQEARTSSLVEGVAYVLCKDARADGGVCGPEGKLFSSKFHTHG